MNWNIYKDTINVSLLYIIVFYSIRIVQASLSISQAWASLVNSVSRKKKTHSRQPNPLTIVKRKTPEINVKLPYTWTTFNGITLKLASTCPGRLCRWGHRKVPTEGTTVRVYSAVVFIDLFSLHTFRLSWRCFNITKKST